MQHPDETELCPSHGEKQTPLLWTTKFNNYELWCPLCGYKCGLFDNTGVNIEEPSVELLTTVKELEAYAEHFLSGKVSTWTYENGETEIT